MREILALILINTLPIIVVFTIGYFALLKYLNKGEK